MVSWRQQPLVEPARAPPRGAPDPHEPLPGGAPAASAAVAQGPPQASLGERTLTRRPELVLQVVVLLRSNIYVTCLGSGLGWSGKCSDSLQTYCCFVTSRRETSWYLRPRGVRLTRLEARSSLASTLSLPRHTLAALSTCLELCPE